MKKNILLSLLLALLLMTGCGRSSGESSTPSSSPEASLEHPQKNTGKTTLYLAGLMPDLNLTTLVNAFNQSSEEYEVVYNSYAGNQNELEQAMLRMNTEVLAGNPPDMIFFPYSLYESGLTDPSPMIYISKGYLMDLDPFFENDPDIKGEDLCAWDALHQYGELYLLSPYFMTEGMLCLPDTAQNLDGNWTVDTYLAMEQGLSEDQMMIYKMSPSIYIDSFIPPYLSHALDISNASCDFYNTTFIHLLELAAEPSSFDGDAYWQKVPEWFSSGQMLFTHDAISSPASLGLAEYRYGCDVTCIGYPSQNGSTAIRVIPTTSVGVSAKTEHPEGCWAFLKYILIHSMDQYQNTMPGAPAYKPAMKSFVSYWQNQNIKYSVEQRHADAFIALVDRSAELAFYDTTVMKIIREETDIMFKGDATAEQTAKNIQDRVSLYMMEHYG